MNTQDGTLSFDAWINNTDFKRQIDEMTAKIKGMGETATTTGAGMDSTFKKVGAAIGTYFGAQMMLKFGMAVKDVRGEFEQMGVAFEVMLASKERADALMGQIVELAAKTPFTLQEVGGLSKQLLAFGEDSSTVVETVRRLGDVAAGTGGEIKGLGIAYGQVMTKGKLMSQELYQFAEKGVPIVAALADMFGVTSREVLKMVEAGEVGFGAVKQAIINMTSEGGKFNNMMEKQSKTVTGLYSNMQDAWSQMLNSIGESNEGVLKGAIMGITNLIKNYEQLLNIVKVAVVTFGTYKAAILLTAAAEKTATLVKLEMALAEKSITYWQGLHAVLLKKLTVSQALFNKTMLANPYALVITAIASLITLLVIYRDKLTAAERAEQEFSDSQRSMAEAAKEHKDRVETLINTINDATEADSERVKALKELKDLYPAIFSQYDIESLKLADILRLKKEISEEEVKRATAANESEVEKLQAEVGDLERRLQYELDNPDYYDQVGAQATYISDLTKQLATAREKLKLYQQQVQSDRNAIVMASLKDFSNDQIQQELANHQRLMEEMQKQGAPATADVKEGLFTGTLNMDDIKAQTQALQAELNRRSEAQFTYHELLKKYEAERLEMEKERQKIMSNPDQLPEKDLLEQLAKVDAKIKAITEKEEALRGAKPKVDKVDVEPEMKAFDRAIKYKQSQYSLYYQWIAEMGKESADMEFAELLSKGATFSAYIQSEIDRLKAKANLTPAEKEQLKKLQEDILPDAVDFTKESDITIYTQKVTEQADSYDKLSAKIEYLKNELISIDETTNSGLQKRLAVMGMLHDAQKQFAEDEKARYKQLKEDYMSVQQQIVKATEQTNKDVAELNKNGDTEQAQERQRQGDEQIKTLQATLLEQMGLLDVYAGQGTDFIIKKIKAVFPTFQDFSTLTRKQLKEVSDLVSGIEITPDQFAELEKAGVDVELLKTMFEALKIQIEKGINMTEWEQLRDIVGGISNGLRSLGGALSQLDNDLGDIGNSLGYMGDSLESIVLLMKETATTGDKISAGMSALSNIIGMIIQQSEENKRVLQEWEDAVLNTEIEMAKLRLQLLEYQQSNLFGVENPFEAAVVGSERYAQALEELLGLEELLAGSMVQTGTTEKVDWGNVAEGAAEGAVLGATIGAAVGTIIPVIGNAIGAVVGGVVGGLVGGIVGLFNKEVVPVFETLREEYGQIYDPETFALNPEILADYDKLSEGAQQLVDAWGDIQAEAQEAKEQMEQVFSDMAGSMGNDLRDTLVEAFRNGELYSAIDEFHTKVVGVLEDIIAQMIFGTIFKQYFDDLQAGMMASFEAGGDMTIVDDIVAFMEQYTAALPAFDAAMQAAQDAMAAYGYEVFKPTTDGAQDQLAAAIKGVTEETANLIAGQMNAIRINQAQSLVIVREQLLVLTSINAYASYIVKIHDYLISQKQGSTLSGTGIKV